MTVAGKEVLTFLTAMIRKKICSKCGNTKPATAKEFSLNKRHRWGLGSHCRQCKQATDRVYSRRYRVLNPEWKRENNIKNRPIVNAAVRAWQKINPEKHRAQKLARYAIRKGILKRGRCRYAQCRLKKVDAHHPDYSQPLNVIWLCHSHHKKLHAGLITLPRQIQGRTE
jgi:hypothetical protein